MIILVKGCLSFASNNGQSEQWVLISELRWSCHQIIERANTSHELTSVCFEVYQTERLTPNQEWCKVTLQISPFANKYIQSKLELFYNICFAISGMF